MRVLRDNKESLMAVLEAFVYDPLINWKLQLQPSPTAPNDVIVDTSQALEMANVYTNILSSTLDAFASIISNNLNNVMKRLTSITIILSLPALVTSIYGMNVDIPYSHTQHAFYIPVILSLLVSIVIAWYFMKKKWF